MPKSNTAVATIGIDPGKNTLHLVGPKQISTGERYERLDRRLPLRQLSFFSWKASNVCRRV